MSQYTPHSLDEFVGQEAVKAALRPRIQQAIDTNRPLPHISLVSEPGFGKTTLARLIAQEVDDPFHVLDVAQLNEQRLLSYFRRFRAGVVLLDEFHRAAKSQQEMLLQLIEEGFITTPFGGTIEVSWLTCIAATTRPDRIDEAVMSRFPIRLRLDPYTDEEMIQIITQMAATHDVELDRGEAEVLALAAGGVPRMARDLVDAYVSLGYVGRRTAEEALRLVGVDADGLTKDHVSYLKALDRLEGQAGAVPLSNLLRCSQGQLMMLERLLIQKGMITMSPRGRVLLARGDRRLRGTPSNDGREGRRG